ncbi:hypothetical protein WDZ16_10470 [Pseudokineococcus marinus]|uniref:Uncharacterized protein n=1 Tax=Pseudokineococcus marinus TaxID=351215 RepID=A0A849BSV9_9ACTN|nr:hypothetical protein [Pseudokineococcus marinus]NNH22616.1 hypothetical protein [Pseudokineococcus marinus]
MRSPAQDLEELLTDVGPPLSQVPPAWEQILSPEHRAVLSRVSGGVGPGGAVRLHLGAADTDLMRNST